MIDCPIDWWFDPFISVVSGVMIGMFIAQVIFNRSDIVSYEKIVSLVVKIKSGLVSVNPTHAAVAFVSGCIAQFLVGRIV